MSRNSRPILLLLCLVFLAACNRDLPPPVLPNMLVQVAGEVEVRRQGSSNFVPVALGATVHPGDTLHLLSGQAAIFCGNEWDASPKPLPVGQNHGVPCQEGRPHRPEAEISFRRGGEDSVGSQIPYTLSPRSGFVTDERPMLRWHLLEGGSTYTVTLASDDGQQRPPVSASGGEMPYPNEWPPLQAGGASYRLQVYYEGPRPNEEEGFSLLSSEKAAQVRDQAERLRQRPVDEPSLTLLLAELYLNDALRSEAVDLLLALPNADQVVAVQRLLGETYLAMGLVHEAAAAYEQMFAIDPSASLPEDQAAAHVGLGLVACAQLDKENARAHWEQALGLYQKMERQTQTLQTRLAEIDDKCVAPPQPTPTTPAP